MFKFLKKLKSKKTQDLQQSFGLSDGGLDESFLFDFRNYQAGSTWASGNGTFIVQNSFISTNADSNIDGENPQIKASVVDPPQKIRIKPIEVLEELEKIPKPWDLNNLDDKISVLEYKRDLITQKYAKREVVALIERLQNRKQWDKFSKYFNQFENTTDEKIGALLEKYDLEMRTSDIFIPEFPDDAIKVMKSYTDQLKKLCGKKPVFYVIAEPDKFKKAYDKRDPILLVQSPFGFYWQILGAWDKEMLLLHEL